MDKKQHPNEAAVFLRRGFVRESYLVYFNRLDRPMGVLTKPYDVTHLVSLETGDPKMCYSPTTFAAPCGNLSLRKINLSLSDEAVQTKDGVRMFAFISVEFRLQKSKHALKAALEKGVFPTFAIDFSNRVKLIVGAAIGQHSMEGVIEEQRSLSAMCEAQLRQSVEKDLAVKVDALSFQITPAQQAVTSPQSTDADLDGDSASELRRYLRVFEERNLPLAKSDVLELARAVNDKDKIRVLAKSSVPLIIVPAEGSGLVSADLANLRPKDGRLNGKLDPQVLGKEPGADPDDIPPISLH